MPKHMVLLPGLAVALLLVVRAPAVRAQELPAADGLERGDEVLLTAPLAAPRASFFHAALDVPPMERAFLLPAGDGYWRLSSNHAESDEEETIDGVENRFDGFFHEWASLEGRFAPGDRLELSLRAAFAGWDEHKDDFSLFDAAGTPIVRGEDAVISKTGASNRHVNLSSLFVRALTPLVATDDRESQLSLEISAKIPVARAQDLSNAGTYDVGALLVGSSRFDRTTLHLNLGVVAPLGSQDLFVPAADVELDPFLHAGIGATRLLTDRLALVVQLEGNTSAFRDVEFLEGPPLSLFAGLRALAGSWIVEFGAGAGLIASSTYEYALTLGVGRRF